MDRLLFLPDADLAALEALAARVAGAARRGDAILLKGDLGVGKTTFARAFLRALGVREDVPSPTFTLVQTYDAAAAGAPVTIWHFDLYRLESATEAFELGLEDAFDTGISLIEWPDVAASLMPEDRLDIRLSMAEDEGRRSIAVCAGAGWRGRGLTP